MHLKSSRIIQDPSFRKTWICCKRRDIRLKKQAKDWHQIRNQRKRLLPFGIFVRTLWTICLLSKQHCKKIDSCCLSWIKRKFDLYLSQCFYTCRTRRRRSLSKKLSQSFHSLPLLFQKGLHSYCCKLVSFRFQARSWV